MADGYISGGGSGGDVVGPGSSTDNAVARFDGTTGKLLQDSVVIVDDVGATSGITQLDVDNIRVDGNTIITTNSNGDLNITPDGTGKTNLTEITLTTDLAVEDGGTGRSSHTAYAVVCGGTTTTAAQQSIASVGTSGQVLTSNGAGALPTFQTASAAPSLNAASYMYGFADFISANNSPDEFSRYSSGGSGGFVGSAGEPQHPGIYQCSTSSSASGRSILYNGQGYFVMGGGQFECEWCVNLKTALSDGTETYTAFVGCYDDAFTTVISSVNDLIGFRYTHTENSGNWTAVARSGGTESTGDLGVAAAADTWVRLKVIVNAAASSVSYYINDVEGSNSPLTTNITTNPLLFGAYIGKSAGTTSRAIYLDYCAWLQSFSSTRND